MNYTKKLMLAPGFRQPPIECMVEVEIDTDAVAAYLGRRAIANKSRRSRALHGIMSCTVRETIASKQARDYVTTKGPITDK